MPAVQTVYTENIKNGFPGMIVNSEAYNKISRTAVGAAIPFGQPVVRVTPHSCSLATAKTLVAVAAAVAGNVGNGVMGAVTTQPGAIEGVYKLTVIHTVTNAGAFIVEDPRGIIVGHGTVGALYTGPGLSFTLADGATDFIAGDQFTFTVTATGPTATLDLLGISVKDDTLGSETSQYVAGNSVAVLTMGVIRVTCGATVVGGDLAYWNVAAKKFTNTASDMPMIFNGRQAKFDAGGVDTDIIRLALR